MIKNISILKKINDIDHMSIIKTEIRRRKRLVIKEINLREKEDL